MELLQDFDGLFDLLDIEKRAFLTIEQIQDFHESIHFKSINSKHVRAACKYVSGTNSEDKVDKEHFLAVLEELARRQLVEEQARWDFLALDTNGSYCIAVKDALLLFRAIHGDQFSMQTWQRFLKSRENPKADVNFDEIKMWLCDHLSGEIFAEHEYSNEKSRLDKYSEMEAENDFEAYQQHKKFRGKENLKYQEYRNEAKQLARRKQQRWEKEGIEALLYDDGLDLGGETPKVVRKKVRASDLKDCLDEKYQMIRKLIFTKMLEGDKGEIIWSALTDSEQQEALLQLQLQEEQLMKDNSLDEAAAATLPGSNVMFACSLVGMMGEIVPGKQKELLEERRRTLQNTGKDDNTTEEELRTFFENAVNAPASSKAMVLELEQRYKEEKEKVLSSIHTEAATAWSTNQLVVGYCRLVRQLAVGKLEEGLIAVATAIGIGERPQKDTLTQFSPDVLFQERLAAHRMTHRKGRHLNLPMGDINIASVKQSGKHAALTLLVEELTWKHAHEWQEFVNMLGNKEWKSVMLKAEQMTPEEHRHWQSSLHQQRLAWRNSSVDYRMTHRKQHLEILMNATGIYLAGKGAELEKLRGANGVDDDILSAVVLRDLQIRQDTEFESLLQEMAGKTEEELGKFASLARSSRHEELFDNIATLLLGSCDFSDEERPFMEALEQKYRALQQALLYHALKAEHGLAWDRFTDVEQQRKLVKRKNEMDYLMQNDIYLRDVSSIIGAIPKEFPNLRSLIGESRGEYKRRMDIFTIRLDNVAVSEVDSPLSVPENDEVPPESLKSINLVADLKNRFFTEQGDLLTLLRSAKSESSGSHLSQLAQIKFEQIRVEKEEWFDLASFSLGLLERNKAALETRHPADRWRQSQLAELRVELFLMRVSRSQLFKKELDEYARPADGDKVGWILSLLKEMDKKHVEEREILMSILQDPSLEELLEPAQQMSLQERTERLSHLRTKAFNLDKDDRGQREENFSILEEAAALKSVNVKTKLEKENLDFRQKNIIVHLLTELQNIQDREMAKLMQKLPLMDKNEMKKARKFEIKQRHMEIAENVLKVLTEYDGPAGKDDALIKALDDKYDALKDKLLIEALMRQMGEKEWQELSEKERQRRLMMLKMQEKKMRREGNLDELAKLFIDSQMSEELLRKLLGESKAEQECRLQKKLAQRERRIAQGLDPDKEESYDEDAAAENDAKDALASLMDRYQEDKDALLARLRGMNKEYLSEQERQAELLRLRRERLLVQKADDFENAARLVGLAERQGLQAQERFEKDRLRQEQLAKERMEQLRQSRNQEALKDGTVIDNGNREDLMDAVIQRLDEQHTAEQILLMELLDGCHGDSEVIAMVMTQLECQERLHALSGNFKRDNSQKVLEEAANIKVEWRRTILLLKSGETEVSDEEIRVSLLADLQDKQDQEVAKVITDMQDKEDIELVNLQKKHIQQRDNNPEGNVAAILFASEKILSADNQLIDALDTKYDVLRDKLLMEALIQQLGESHWQNMSEQERQLKFAELKLTERKLRREGRYDEAAELLGNSMRNQEAIEMLLGSAKADQERILQERLERRQQARERGLSEEEIDRLEEVEMKKEQMERRNVLLALKKEYDTERDELLQSLEASRDSEDAKRKRQMIIARLKRDQRRMRQEERFDAAAVLMNMAKDQESRLESDREKQLQLARARLEARQARKVNGQPDLVENAEKQILIWESEDVEVLQDVLLHEIEAKHQQEREFLLQIVDSDKSAHPLNDVADVDTDEIEQQLMILRGKQDNLKKIGDLANKNRMLEEGIHLKMMMLKHKAESDGHQFAQDDLAVLLLAELQEIQDKEMEKLTMNIDGLEVKDLKQMKNLQAIARQQQWNDNVAKILGSVSSDKSEDSEVIEALDKKYDALRDKLLMKALISKMGEAEWAALSEKERQQKLVRLKLEEKKLRLEGRYEEAAALLGQLMDNQNEYNRKLGETQAAQKHKLEERLKRRKELTVERSARGLSTDKTLLDALIDQEEDAKIPKKKNILEELQHHYDEEREALMAALTGQNDRLAAERTRQAQLVKLRRERQHFEKEGNFESAALLLQAAEQQQRNRESDMANAREQQRELAKERLAARKRLQQQNGGRSEEMNDEAMKKMLMTQTKRDETSDAMKKLAGVKADEMVLCEIDQKHDEERELMFNLIELGKKNLSQLDSLSCQELVNRLDSLQSDINRWQQQSKQDAGKLGEEMSEDDRQKLLDTMALRRRDIFALLSSALATKMKMDVESLSKTSSLETVAAVEEVAVHLLTVLQEKQGGELGAIEDIVNEQDDDMLKGIHSSLRSSRQEGSPDNIIKIIFASKSEESGILYEEEESLAKREELEEQLNKEFEREKEELINKAKTGQLSTDLDLDNELRKLQEQQDARKKALDKAFENQRQKVRAKLEARRMAQEKEEYKTDMANEMIQKALLQNDVRQDVEQQEKGRQNDLMKKRLAARREARKRAIEDDMASSSSSASTPLPPGSGLRRRNSIGEALSEEKGQEIYSQLVREQTQVRQKISRDQQRQQNMVEERLKARKNRRKGEIDALFSQGERQKSILEKSRKEEKERQITAMRERVARVRYERTLTTKDKNVEASRKFDELLSEEEASGLSEDAKMELAAKRMQEQLQSEKITQPDGTKNDGPNENFGIGKKLDDGDKMKKLKERKEKKKLLRQQLKKKDEDGPP